MYRTVKNIMMLLPILIVFGCSSGTTAPPAGSTASSNTAVFDPSAGNVPLPNILATATAANPLTGRAANKPMTPPEALAYVNIYEMGGTHAVSGLNAPIYIRFQQPVNPATVSPSTVKVFQLGVDSNGLTESAPLGFTDISAMFDFTYSAGGTDLHLFPKFPLQPGSRYLYVVTSGVKDAATGGSLSGSFYFEALKATSPLLGAFAGLEAIRANVYADSPTNTVVKLSGYAKVMDDLIAASGTTGINSRAQIALIGRFITTGAGFVSRDGTGSTASMMPVESALRSFAAGAGLGGLAGKTWTNSIGTTTVLTPAAFWTGAGSTVSAPATVASVIKGSINSAQLSIDPVVAKTNPAGIDLTGVTLGGLPAYNPAAGVSQAFRDAAGVLTGYYHTTMTVPFVYFVPTGTAPAGGWPLVIYQHGIGSTKEAQAMAVVGSITAEGFAVVAIDLPLHGELAISGHTAANWVMDFIALGAPLATRSNAQQAAFNLHRLELTLLGGGFAVLGADAPNRTTVKPKYVGHSMGSIVGAYYLAGNTTLSTTGYPYTQATLNSDMKGFLSVPGGRMMYYLQDSAVYGPPAIAGLASMGIATNSPTYHSFWLVSQSIIDPVDPATMTSPLAAGLPSRLSGRVVIQECVGDQSAPNSSTRYLGNALGGRGVLGATGAAVAPGFKQLGYGGGTSPRIPATFMYALDATTGAPTAKVDFAAASAAATTPTEGYFQFDQAGATHTFLLDPTNSPTATEYAQKQMRYFLSKGIVVDPSTSGLPKSVASAVPGLAGEVLLPPVMKIFGY